MVKLELFANTPVGRRCSIQLQAVTGKIGHEYRVGYLPPLVRPHSDRISSDARKNDGGRAISMSVNNRLLHRAILPR